MSGGAFTLHSCLVQRTPNLNPVSLPPPPPSELRPPPPLPPLLPALRAAPSLARCSAPRASIVSASCASATTPLTCSARWTVSSPGHTCQTWTSITMACACMRLEGVGRGGTHWASRNDPFLTTQQLDGDWGSNLTWLYCTHGGYARGNRFARARGTNVFGRGTPWSRGLASGRALW